MNHLGKIVPPKKFILKEISLSFFPGAKIGVLGLNGAGKSSLLRIMAGVDPDFIGEAFLGKGYGFAQGARVPMVAANGQFGHVEAGKAQEAFQSGARVATPAEIHKAQIHAEYDNFGGFLASGAAEVLTDALIRHPDDIEAFMAASRAPQQRPARHA